MNSSLFAALLKRCPCVITLLFVALMGCARPWQHYATRTGDKEGSTAARTEYAFAIAKAKAGDFATAAYWLRKSAEQRFAFAQTELGSYSARGRGVPRDYAEALLWYRKAAAQEDALAMYCIGYAYAHGHGVAWNMEEAVTWWTKAADLGQAEAENALGQFYFQSADYSEAAGWLRKAAEQGYVASMNNLGFLYQNGFGVEKNLPEAVRWYRAAAEKGEAKAQANLGLMYQDGAGVKTDMVQAYKWFTLSAQQGDVVGKHFFDDYNEHRRLTRDQLARAKELVTEFPVSTAPVLRD